MLQSIELELSKARELAKQNGHSFLCYLIDMAILEARSVASSEISQKTRFYRQMQHTDCGEQVVSTR
jgi:hypothetical protein